MDRPLQAPPKQRAPRVQLANSTHAVLRFQDGHRTSGKLHVLSLNGGLLSVTRPLHKGSRVKLMFLTSAGPVLGGAEMLSPVTSSLQPFRFVSLPVDDRHRVGSTIQASLEQNTAEQQWMEKLRTALADRNQPTKQLVNKVLRAVGFVRSVSFRSTL